VSFPTAAQNDPPNPAKKYAKGPDLARSFSCGSQKRLPLLLRAFKSVAKEAFLGVLFPLAASHYPYLASTKLKLAIRSAFISRILTNKSGLNNESLSLRSSPGKYSCVVNMGPLAD
jgi:hypothetical protein